MQQIMIVSGETAHPRVMLAALTEATVRHMMLRHDREITISMRERGKELLQGAEETKAELIASNLAMKYTLLRAMQDPDEFPAEMELSVMADSQYCGRLRFACLLEDTEGSLPEADVHLLIVSPGAPMLAYPYLERLQKESPGAEVCVALLCDGLPQEDEEPAARLHCMAPEMEACLEGLRSFVCFYHPCGFQRDGSICSPENANPYGIQALFWELVRRSAQRRLEHLSQEIQRHRHTIMRRNSAFQAGSVRRGLELAASRAAYGDAVRGIYEAQCLLAAESGASFGKE